MTSDHSQWPARLALIISACSLVSACGSRPVPAPEAAPSAPIVHISADPRAELLAILFRLAGNPEYNQGRLPTYVEAIDRHFDSVRDHPAVQLARRLRREHGVGFDGVMLYAIHLRKIDGFEPRIPLSDTTTALSRRWRHAPLEDFHSALRAFVRDGRFRAFIASQQPLIDTATARLAGTVRQHADLGWYPRFYGTSPAADFMVVPLLASGAGNFGPRFTAEGHRPELYAILGAGRADSLGLPVFSANVVPTLVHEFNHSFVNALVERHLDALAEPARSIFGRVEQEMRSLAYGSAPIMLWESVVRAAVARYVLEHDGAAAARAEVSDQQAIGFVWMPELFELLGEYEANRERYPTLESFMPRIVAYYRDLAPRAGALLSAYDAKRPRMVASSIPADGVVADTVRVLEFRFDRPMRSGYGMGNVAGRENEHPDVTANPSWDETRTTLRIPVKLSPASRYAFQLNRAIRSAEGFPIRATVIDFRTP